MSWSRAPVVDVGSNDWIGWVLAKDQLVPPLVENVTTTLYSVVPLAVFRSVKTATRSLGSVGSTAIEGLLSLIVVPATPAEACT